MTEEKLAESVEAGRKPLPPEAERALAEAEERRRPHKAGPEAKLPGKEIGGREGLDPIRYGDWEKGGLASDF